VPAEAGVAAAAVVRDPPPGASAPAPPPLLGRVPRAPDERWRWDEDGRLTAMLVPGSSQWLHFDHGERGELRIRAGSGHVYLDVAQNVARLDNGVVEHYGFDAAGRPTRLRATAPSGEPVLDLEIVYDAEGRIVVLGGEAIAYDGEHVAAAARAAGSVRLEYDERGNRCARHAPGEPTTTYRYDAGDRLVAVARDGRTIVRYAYDEHDRRVRREDAAGTILRHYDPAGNLVAETDEHGTAIATYLCVGVRCLARIDGPVGAPVAEWYHLDHGGSAWAVTAASGEVAGRRNGPLDTAATATRRPASSTSARATSIRRPARSPPPTRTRSTRRIRACAPTPAATRGAATDRSEPS
jgi:YD repeat-containing protein